MTHNGVSEDKAVTDQGVIAIKKVFPLAPPGLPARRDCADDKRWQVSWLADRRHLLAFPEVFKTFQWRLME